MQPMIYTYLKKYQEDPSSRVFAPLAEAYRKAGLTDEAIEIAREGLRVHPNFVGGKVALARAYFDKKQYEDVVQELKSVVLDVPDNLIAQRLIAESYLMLGRLAEAIGAYKMLLYFSPQDADTAKMVKELENQAYEKGTLVLRTDPPPPAKVDGFNVRPARGAIDSDPEVIQEKKKAGLIRKIEFLQDMLQKLERYKGLSR
jgi:tetratricopeptide (TPR) repeat protein